MSPGKRVLPVYRVQECSLQAMLGGWGGLGAEFGFKLINILLLMLLFVIQFGVAGHAGGGGMSADFGLKLNEIKCLLLFLFINFGVAGHAGGRHGRRIWCRERGEQTEKKAREKGVGCRGSFF